MKEAVTGTTPGGTWLRRASIAVLTVSALLAAAARPAHAAPIAEHVPSTSDRYSLAQGCFALRSQQTGDYVVKVGTAYAATGASLAGAEPFRMQASDLGRYLFYGPAPDFMARDPLLNGIQAAAQPSDDSDWTVTEDAGAFRISNGFAGRDLAVGVGDALTTVPAGTAGAAGLFTFEAASGCADYPEIEVNVSGPLPASHAPDSTVTGLVETHMHHMAFEFLGTKAHCGRPWHRFGAPSALVDCADHGPNGCSAVLENAISGTVCHDPGGWPTFAGWPDHRQLTHEQSYYKWVERSWRAGLRVFVMLAVENRVLCEIYPLTPPGHSCNEMASVRRELQRARELEAYIDAQWGGPGKGWYRIVESPEEARHVINDGKLAVVLGMEVSEPFGCRLMQPGDMPTCTADQVTGGIQELYDLGVRQLELVNKFDNALTGVAGDSGSTGTITNLGNFESAGTFWDYEHCDDPVNNDHSPSALSHNDDQLISNGLDVFGDTTGITFPIYGAEPHCNQRGLYKLGEVAVEKIMDNGMLFDPDHQSVLGRNEALDLVESRYYPGVMTSHSWSTENAIPRIEALGGLIGPAAKSPDGFVENWNHVKSAGVLSPYLFGFGYGADMNGFASQGGPPSVTVNYPFTSPVDPTVTVDKQQSGSRTFDINVDGTAHYGMYADWAQAVYLLGGGEMFNDMKNGAEAYLQMWERAAGSAAAGAGAGSGGGSAGSGQGATPGSSAANQASACVGITTKLKKAKSKKAKRKLRRKLRQQGCAQVKKKKKKKRKRKK